MNLVEAIFIIGILGIVCGEKFSQFVSLKDTAILNNQSKEGVLVDKHFVSDRLFCILECNKHKECESVSYDNENSCTLYNDLISLFHLTKNSECVFYSKNKLPFCNRLSYHDVTDNVCLPKKTNGLDCSSSEQCKDIANFDCTNSFCQCNTLY